VDRPNTEGTRAPPERESESSSAANKRLRIVTRCGTLDEFFATFGPFADDTSLFIVTNKPRPLGLRQPFVIQLREGETIMRGDVEVVQSITDGTGPDGRNGMRLRLEQADDATRDMLHRLVESAKQKRARTTERPPDSVAVASEARPALETKAPPKPPAPPPAAGSPATAPATIAPKGPVADDAPPPSRSGAELSSGERAPGASYQLPANPFEGVTAEALESFVECTLYEERVPRGSEADAPPLDAPMPSRSEGGLSSFPQSIVTASPATLAPPGSPALPPLPALPPPPPTFAAPPPPTFGPAPGAAGPEKPPVRDAVLLAAAIQAGSIPQRKPWFAWVIGTAVASSLASLAAAYFMWGRAPVAPPAEPTTAITASSPAPERTGTSTSAPALTASAAPTISASATPSAAPSTPLLKRECKANVRSYPTGATVLWNGESIGLSPLQDIPVPCGPAKVTFDLTGYEHGERSAGAVVGKNAGVFIRLVPILVSVDVTSTPPGAQILVDGRTVGRTPSSISMVGMREATLVVTLPRFKPFKQKVTPEPPKLSIHADLQSN